MKIFWTVALLASMGAIYWWLIRPALRTRPELKDLFDRLDALEAGLWARIKARLDGWKLVSAGLAAVAGVEVLDVLNDLQAIDLTAWLPEAQAKAVGQLLVLAGVAVKLGKLIRDRMAERASDGEA